MNALLLAVMVAVPATKLHVPITLDDDQRSALAPLAAAAWPGLVPEGLKHLWCDSYERVRSELQGPEGEEVPVLVTELVAACGAVSEQVRTASEIAADEASKRLLTKPVGDAVATDGSSATVQLVWPRAVKTHVQMAPLLAFVQAQFGVAAADLRKVVVREVPVMGTEIVDEEEIQVVVGYAFEMRVEEAVDVSLKDRLLCLKDMSCR